MEVVGEEGVVVVEVVELVEVVEVDKLQVRRLEEVEEAVVHRSEEHRLEVVEAPYIAGEHFAFYGIPPTHVLMAYISF